MKNNVLEKGKLYPTPWYPNHRVKWEGKRGKPKKGEWYLSGAIIEGYQAPNDLTLEYPIGRLVRVRKVEYWEEVEDGS